MKLIKINTDHYIIVDNSEIRENDLCYDPEGNPGHNNIKYVVKCLRTASDSYWNKHCKKITHSTMPLIIDFVTYRGTLREIKKSNLSLSEVKELIGEVDVEKKAEDWFESQGHNIYNHYNTMPSFIDGYNQALEDNKEKKYTEEDMINAAKYGYEFRDTTSFPEHKFEDSCINNTKQWLQWYSEPKTEWEVEFIDGKLKLK